MPVALTLLAPAAMVIYGLTYALLARNGRLDEWEERQARAFLGDG